ncbi:MULTISPECIES: hypothetical protein [Arcobacteraceae]|uniref:Cobalt/nickel ECF transporter CbiMNQO, S component CbiN n=1 Tax=Aliarcobacter thereius LMG 24486 TaxID=1032240 RepID=A0A1C7WQZ1_9BACT|nr:MULTISPECIES: hypothetical protein [Arcobacteraceae]OCL83406.1 hypothetical protein AAW29_01000 [Arcobacter porcinus]OCL95167.1 hypothetical protein AA347_00618 [Aliarcobacter thereius LMG 24486]QBF16843.1 Co/Ni ECF transporter CbiMNQO, S component CbiN [Aliarcobacter thereius LMG 24486]TLS94128.1 hypothetical protein FE244_02320 [Aliarcobacter thereius]
MRIFLILVLPIFLFAHKINMYLDIKDDSLYINSYFANAKPCKNCKFKIETKDRLVLEDRLNDNGEYIYKGSNEYFKVTVDAGSSHIVTKEIESLKIKNENIIEEKIEDKKLKDLIEENSLLKNKIEVLEEQLNYFEIFKIVFGLILISLIFLIIKRVKS